MTVTQGSELPTDFNSFRDFHAGETILVCGCGSSLNELQDPNTFITIGVNDVGRLFDPSYLVVLNPRHQFKGNRFHYVENSRAKVVFSQLNLQIPHPQLIRFRLGKRGGTDLSDPHTLHYTRNSPYAALCLALHMGARRIGLIGVDFTDDHFFGPTGPHILSRQITQINREYERLGQACRKQGIEIINLSAKSRLTAFPKGGIEDLMADSGDDTHRGAKSTYSDKRVFCVNYRFLSCGDVFTHGLRNAAQDLGIEYEDAYWDDKELLAKVNRFSPDLLFVVHGRKFAKRWRTAFSAYKSAVWLLDEPYEVDETASWSNLFDTVYVNDQSTLHRHRNAHYLPVAYNPHVHLEVPRTKEYSVGFVGGHNRRRERLLLELLDAGLLSYLVGGPWKTARLQRQCLSRNIPSVETAALYQQTRLIVNIFREVHHYNRQRISPYSLNPRVYEGLACGSLVVTERRSELERVFPELPAFNDDTELSSIVENLLGDDLRYQEIRAQCQARLPGHTYVDRFRTVLEVSLGIAVVPRKEQMTKAGDAPMKQQSVVIKTRANLMDGWLDYGAISSAGPDGELVLRKPFDNGPGTEEGLASEESFGDVELLFEVKMSDDACFIAKLHQLDRLDQTTNSYHLYCHPQHTYLAMHNRIFQDIQIERGVWQSILMRWAAGLLTLSVDGVTVASVRNRLLRTGYCFLGIKGGEAKIRNIRLVSLNPMRSMTLLEKKETAQESNSREVPDFTVLNRLERLKTSFTPKVSIITTVYDRVACLRDCIRSVKHLVFQDFEHIVVSDHPPKQIVESILSLVKREGDGRVLYANLNRRFNNWGIAPATAGLQLARGKYVCFLSDDNGYTSDHMSNLVSILERDNRIGFAYSSCRYGGRLMLRSSIPRPGRIDLGQPLFRRELFECYLGGTLPFDMMAWDWHMIERFMQNGVKWRHLNRPTFLFRLQACRDQMVH